MTSWTTKAASLARPNETSVHQNVSANTGSPSCGVFGVTGPAWLRWSLVCSSQLMKSLFNISIRPTKAGWFLICSSGLFTLLLLFGTFSWALEPINKGITRVPFRIFVSVVFGSGSVFFLLGLWVLRRRKVQVFKVQV